MVLSPVATSFDLEIYCFLILSVGYRLENRRQRGTRGICDETRSTDQKKEQKQTNLRR